MTESLLLILALVAIGAAAFFAYRSAKAQESAAAAKARFEGVDMIRAERDRAVAGLGDDFIETNHLSVMLLCPHGRN